MSTTPSAQVPSRSCCAPEDPSGVEVRAHLRRLVRHIRDAGPGRASPSRRGHYARPRRWNGRPTIPITSSGCQARSRCRRKSTRRRMRCEPSALCRTSPSCAGYAETRHKAKSWSRAARVARIEASLGSTPLRLHQVEDGRQKSVPTPSIARGTAENLIGLHKTQLASDRSPVRDRQPGPPCCTLRLTGSCSLFATPSRNRAIPPTPSFSTLRLRLIRSPPASSKPRAVSVSLSPPAAGGRPPPRPARNPRPARTLNGGARSASAPGDPYNAFAKMVVRR